MTRSRDEEDPAQLRGDMKISDKITCWLDWIGFGFRVLTVLIVMMILQPFWMLHAKLRRIILSSWWDTIFVISCVIAVSLDPLFLYILTVNGEQKCLEIDTKLRTVSLVLRSLTDIIFIIDSTYGIYLATLSRRSMVVDFLAILPLPQVLLVVIFYKNRDFVYLDNSKILNLFLFIQYVPRIYRLNQSFDNIKRKKGTGLWIKVAFNSFLYILACHILGASWFFFSVQREMSCWHKTCSTYNTCGSNFKCNDNSSRITTELAQLCPMNPPNSTIFDFGIFVNPLATSSTTPINFSTKFSYSFWWGVRNMSNFATNLETSTYLWETWFATLISVVGLLLFLYLIGNNVQTYMQMKTAKADEEDERMRQKLLHQQTRINLWMDRHDFDGYMDEKIKTKVTEKYHERNEVNLDNVLALLSLIESDTDLGRSTRHIICKKLLEIVPLLKDMSDMNSMVLYQITDWMEVVEMDENTLIVKMDDPLDRMLFITEGEVGIYTASTHSSPSAIIRGSLEESGVYGLDEQLLSWALSPNPGLDHLPISKETVKCHTKVEGFVLTASYLIGFQAILSLFGISKYNKSYELDDGEVCNSIEEESSFTLRSAVIVATTASRFRQHLRRKKPALDLDIDPSSYKGL